MAVITSAALAGTAITAATIASGVGVAATVGTTAMSFAKAKKQRDLENDANDAAAEAMKAARQKLEVNVYDKLAIQKEPYELQREAMLSQGAQAIQAGVESERGAAATAGRVQMAANEGQAAIRSAMGQDLQQLEMLSAQEEGRLRDIGVQLDLEEVAGAQLAAANAQELGAQATQQGFQGVTSLTSQLADAVPLFDKTASARQAQRIGQTLENKYGQSQTGIQTNLAKLGIVDGIDFSKVAGLSQPDFDEFMIGVPASTLKKINQNLPNTVQSFSPTYTPPKTSITGLNIYPNTGFVFGK